MRKTRVIGILLVVVGIATVVFANYQKGRVAEAKRDIDQGSGLFSIGGNPIVQKAGEMVTGTMQDKASSYDQPLMLLQIGGVVLIVIGAGMTLFCGCKKR